jgi:hypothetical protein
MLVTGEDVIVPAPSRHFVAVLTKGAPRTPLEWFGASMTRPSITAALHEGRDLS